MNKTGISRIMRTVCGVLVVLWNCGRIAQADFVYGEPTKVPNVNSDFSEDSEPQISRDGLELYFVSNRADSQGESSDNIWVARRPTINDPWSTPVRLDAPVNTTGVENSPSLSADGLELYFSNSWFSNPAKLYVSTRAGKIDPWGPPVELAPPVNSEYKQDCPCISADGLSLYFMSDRPGEGVTSGNIDIFVTTRRTKDAPWGEPERLGPNVNSELVEYTPWISPDGLSLFFSRGYGKAHVWVCRRKTTADPWGPAEFFVPVNSGTNVDGSAPGGFAEWNLSFAPGDPMLYFARASALFATDYDLWQVVVTPVVDFNGDAKVDEQDFLALTQHWGQDHPQCDIGPMAWGDGVVDEKDLAVLMESAMTPGPKASDVPCSTVLSWVGPWFAGGYDVYFGTSLDGVSNATRGDPCGVLVSEGQAETTYDPEGLLEFGQAYYWRVDSIDVVIGSLEPMICRGPILKFTTEAFARPIQNITAMASSSQAGMGPEKTVNGSGLDKNDGHSTNGSDMWLSTNAKPHWIQFEFDKVYTLHELWVWNSNQVIEPILGFGAKTVRIEYSTDSATWTVLDGVPEFARAPGQPGYAADTIVSFAGVSAKYVKLTIEKGWGATPSAGLSEVRFFYIPDRSATNL
jgi:hypothetical protein